MKRSIGIALCVAALVTLSLLGLEAVRPKPADSAVGSAPIFGLGPAPITRDYEERNALITFWEGAVQEHHHNDVLSPRELAGQYMQRFRETGDIDDVARAQAMVERALQIQPHNIPATAELASVMLALHRFEPALDAVTKVLLAMPTSADFLAQKASLQMELGRYADAKHSLQSIPVADRTGVAAQTVGSRYAEMVGHPEIARQMLNNAMIEMDRHIDEPAQARAWYRVRAGELAFNSGHVSAAISDERQALSIFPTYNLAFKDLAKFELAGHNYREALVAAMAGARITPYAETLGYEADAQTALGDRRSAQATREVIYAIERLGNAYRVNDRLLAIYYTEHRLRPHDALEIARREVDLRGAEIYAQDTLAWAAAMDNRWKQAQVAIARALRYDTADPLLQYHAGIIALHVGDRADAKKYLTRALTLNPHFHPTYADDARKQLGCLASTSS